MGEVPFFTVVVVVVVLWGEFLGEIKIFLIVKKLSRQCR